MKNKLVPLLIVFVILSGCSSKKIEHYITDYNLHLEDLACIESNGYKHNFGGIDVQGSIRITNNPLDCAVLGSGFFKMLNPETNRVFYSRDGAFSINHDGYIVNRDGYLLFPYIHLPLDGSIRSVSISKDGDIIANSDNHKIIIAEISLFNRLGDSYIKNGNYFIFRTAEKNPDIRIIPGALEESNFSVFNKIYSLQEILYSLKDSDPERNQFYYFRIKLLDELITAYKTQADADTADCFYKELRESAELLYLHK